MLSRRYRALLILCGLLIATGSTSVLVQRQTALLPQALAAQSAANRDNRIVPSSATATPGIPDAPPQDTGPTPTPGVQVPPPAPPRATLINRERFFYEPNFYAAQVQAYLDTQPGPLRGLRAPIGDREQSLAEIVSSAATYISVNPKVILTLIEQQSGALTNPAPSEDQLKWLLAYRGENERRAGWVAQLDWLRRELHRAQSDFPNNPQLTYADASRSPLPPGLGVADYAIARVLAQTTSAADLPNKLDRGNSSFVATYTRLFGDPREAPVDLPAPAVPFLSLPMDKPHQITSFFDHDSPFLQQNGSIVTYRGERSIDPRMSYDGHDGWDIAMLPPEPVLAAADGTVVFAGNAADGCNTRAVVIDHGNGYRTLYWHLGKVTAQPGPIKRGDKVGVAGASGCGTGPHLHFSVQYLGRGTDAYGWCGPQGGDPWANHPAGQTSRWLWRDVPSPCNLPQNAVVVDTTDPGFKRIGAGWKEVALGFGGTALYAPSATANSSRLTIGVWRPSLPRAGKYRVLAWIPYILSDLKDAENAQYVVGHADGSGDTKTITISQWTTGNWWADLGVYEFDPARAPFVGLTATDRDAGNNVWYDAVIWIPVE